MMNTTAGIHITMHNDGTKMEGLQSISTSVLENPFCKARRNRPGTVCAKCYAAHLNSYRKTLANALLRNYDLLNSGLLPEKTLLRANLFTRYVRIESFGDVASDTCARNYIRIIRLNPEINFGIWSKNHGIWARAFAAEGKPENCTYVLSSPLLNTPGNIPACIRGYVDHVFTVWEPKNYVFAGTPTECAGIRCLKCLKCYKKGTSFYINEKLR